MNMKIIAKRGKTNISFIVLILFLFAGALILVADAAIKKEREVIETTERQTVVLRETECETQSSTFLESEILSWSQKNPAQQVSPYPETTAAAPKATEKPAVQKPDETQSPPKTQALTETLALKKLLPQDRTPPTISGDLDKWVVAGGTVSYRAGVTVTDDFDTDVKLIVDSSRVNLNVPGVYTVIYSATDSSGNRAEARGTVTVRAVDMDLVNEMADGILSRITNQNMSKYEKAKAIFYWIHGKMKYSASVCPREIAQAAYNCFHRGTGDCYTYMAASRVLLTRAGIDNMTVTRIDAPVQHYWNIVNVGDGWYHFDPSPNGYVSIDRKFMFTESQAREFSRITPTAYENYRYDKSLVPEVVE